MDIRFTLTEEEAEKLKALAEDQVRTPRDQVKYMIRILLADEEPEPEYVINAYFSQAPSDETVGWLKRRIIERIHGGGDGEEQAAE